MSGSPHGFGTPQFGRRQTSFSESSYDTATSQGPDLCASGSSFVLEFDNPSGAKAPHAIPLGRYDASSGCYVDVQAGVVTIIQNPGSIVANLGLTVVAGPGPHVLAVAVTGGSFRAFLDGVGSGASPAVFATSRTIAAPDASAGMTLGAGNGGTAPWTGGVLHVKAYARVLSDLELYALSGNRQDNRYALMSAATGDSPLALDARPGLDWDGSASTWTSRGSSPVTFTVRGRPQLSTVGECLGKRADFIAGMIDTAPAMLPPTSFGRLLFTTSDAVVYADFGNGDDAAMDIISSVYVDGAYSTALCGPDGCDPSSLTYAGTPGQVLPITVGGGTRTVEVADGEAILTGTPPAAPGTASSQPLLAVRTSSCPIVQVTPLPATGHVAILGDSLCVGAASTQLGRFGWASLLRDEYRGKGVAVSMLCQSGSSLGENSTLFYGSFPASAASMANQLETLVSQVGSGGAKWVVMALGENDLGLSTPFDSELDLLLGAIHAVDPEIDILVSSPAYSCSLEPVAVELRAAERASVLNANSAAGETFAYFLDNTTTVSPANVNACPHYNDAGHAQMEAAVKAALPF
ncbi:MAG TPA: SGNH/GDSL hydrolase family protein [Polyangiaceae bacterium]|jgi:lysophospholipase L1-like esterase